METILFTHLQAPTPVSKTFVLGPERELIKRTAPMPSTGMLTVRGISSLEELKDQLEALTPYECVIWGVPKGIEAGEQRRLTTKARNREGAIPRDREHFEFRTGKPAVLMLDYDPEDGSPAESIDQVTMKLALLHPIFSQVKLLARHSAGGGIHLEGKLLREPRGIRFYAIVTDGNLIPEIQRALCVQAWAKGLGRWQISKAGRLLSRGVFDASVGQPERVDFCGGAHCQPPLQQELPPARIINPEGGMLDGSQLLATPEIEAQAEAMMAATRLQAEQRAQPIRRAFEQTIREKLQSRGVTDSRIKDVLAGLNCEEIELAEEYPLTLDDGTAVTVRDLLENPRSFNGRRMHDPIEPDYHGDNRIAVALLGGGRKTIFSHAHGGITYLLSRPKAPVQITTNTDRAVIDEVARIMSERRALFRRGGSIVTIEQDGILPLSSHALVAVLSEHVEPRKPNPDNDRLRVVGFPHALATAWVDLNGTGLPELNGLVSTPMMLPDGRILHTPGYDPGSGLFLAGSSSVGFTTPESPSDQDVRNALQELWKPFAEFPLASENDRAALLALILTAFTRPAYATAPAGLITAPAQGHGKTLLAKAIAHLAAGEEVAIAPPVSGTNSEDELRKRLFAIARAGKAAVIYDNLDAGSLASPGLCAYLTSGRIEERVLGVSKVEAVPFRSLFLMTGNNVIPEGDLPRRTLLCRIDAGVESAFQGRSFAIRPDEYCLEHRQAMAQAALTVLQAYRRANCPTLGTTFGSFEVWDKMVRQPILWIRERGHFSQSLADPIAGSLEAATKGSVEEVLGVFFRWFEAKFGKSWHTAHEISRALLDPEDPPMAKDPGNPAVAREELREAVLDGLLELRVAYNNRDSFPELAPSKLGHFLKGHRERVINGRRIEKNVAHDRTGRSLWGVSSR